MTQVLVRDIIGPVWQKCSSAPLPMVVQAYIDAARQFCNRSRWLRATIAGATIVDQRLYALGSDPYNEILGLSAIDITEATDDIHGLIQRNSSEWDTTEANDVPVYYQYVPEGSFAVHPKANQVYTLSVGVVLQPKAGSNSIDDTLQVSWSYALQQGALGYLLGMANKPWTDKPEAGINLTRFHTAMASAARSAEAGYNPGAIGTDAIGPRSSGVRTRMLAI